MPGDDAARLAMISRIRSALGRDALPAAEVEALRAELNAPSRNLLPKRAQVSQPDQVELFLQLTAKQGVTHVRIADAAAVPAAIETYLSEKDLGRRVKRSPHPSLDAMPWAHSKLECEVGVGNKGDTVTVTPAFAAIAETGSFVMISAPETPVSLLFVAATHIVVLRASQITGTMEEAWSLLRERFGARTLPRSVTIVSGISSTGDISENLIRHAHGPARLHFLLIEG